MSSHCLVGWGGVSAWLASWRGHPRLRIKKWGKRGWGVWDKQERFVFFPSYVLNTVYLPLQECPSFLFSLFAILYKMDVPQGWLNNPMNELTDGWTFMLRMDRWDIVQR